MPKSADTDHSSGQVKLVRGSGPPLLTVEQHEIGISDRLWVLSLCLYGRNKPPQAATVIGIDLTRRTIRLQLSGGKELLYSAEAKSQDSSLWLFADPALAKHNAVKRAEGAMKEKERAADRALADLQQARDWLAAIRKWDADGKEPVEVADD